MVGMRFALVPAGRFLMGSPEEEKGRRPDETRHEVEITRPFFVGVHEVTQKQYEDVMGSNPSVFRKGGEGWTEVKGLDTSRFPVGMPRLVIDSFIMIMSRDFFAFAWALLIIVRAPLIIAYGLAFFSLLWVVLIVIAAPALLRERARLEPAWLALGRGPS